ncbi:hypothetical protein LINPERHAP1_LOCUS29824 [Linum perenne]
MILTTEPRIRLSIELHHRKPTSSVCFDPSPPQGTCTAYPSFHRKAVFNPEFLPPPELRFPFQLQLLPEKNTLENEMAEVKNAARLEAEQQKRRLDEMENNMVNMQAQMQAFMNAQMQAFMNTNKRP